MKTRVREREGKEPDPGTWRWWEGGDGMETNIIGDDGQLRSVNYRNRG